MSQLKNCTKVYAVTIIENIRGSDKICKLSYFLFDSFTLTIYKKRRRVIIDYNSCYSLRILFMTLNKMNHLMHL